MNLGKRQDCVLSQLVKPPVPIGSKISEKLEGGNQSTSAQYRPLFNLRCATI